MLIELPRLTEVIEADLSSSALFVPTILNKLCYNERLASANKLKVLAMQRIETFKQYPISAHSLCFSEAGAKHNWTRF